MHSQVLEWIFRHSLHRKPLEIQLCTATVRLSMMRAQPICVTFHTLFHSCILDSTFSSSQQERLREVCLEFFKLSYLPMLLHLEINVLTNMDLEFVCILSFVGIAAYETVTFWGEPCVLCS